MRAPAASVSPKSMLPSVDVHCPYCGEAISLLVDASAGDQVYIEDCAVCCRPIIVSIGVDEDGAVHASVRGEDEA